MNDEILKLAKECGVDVFFDSKFGSPDYYHVNSSIPALEAFYRAAFNAGLEAAANVCTKSSIDDFGSLSYVASLIRALEKRP